MTLEDESRKVCDYAAKKAGAGDKRGWNDRFKAAVEEKGYELVPIDEETYTPLSDDPSMEPLWAPSPMEGAANPYPYPCVVAPKGWRATRASAELTSAIEYVLKRHPCLVKSERKGRMSVVAEDVVKHLEKCGYVISKPDRKHNVI